MVTKTEPKLNDCSRLRKTHGFPSKEAEFVSLTQDIQRPEGPWPDAMAIESEITLSDQTRGTEWDFRVIAVNKAGEGEPSNIVMAVL